MQKNNNKKKKSYAGMPWLSSVTPAIVTRFMMLLKKYKIFFYQGKLDTGN